MDTKVDHLCSKEKTNEVECCKELEKSKIDVLRDALKDASDTIRALDRKIFFLTTNTLSIPTAYVGIMYYFFIIQKISILGVDTSYNNVFLIIMSIIVVLPFILAMAKLIETIVPQSNPLMNFSTDIDKEFASDSFYINTLSYDKLCPHVKKIVNFSLDKLLLNFNNFTKTSDDVKKLLLKELVKVSSIRDDKLYNFKQAFKFFKIGFGLMIFIIFFIAVSQIYNIK